MIKTLFLTVYLIATPQEGGNFGGVHNNKGFIKQFEGENALAECIDTIYAIQTEYYQHSKLGVGAPKFYCVPNG